MFSRLTALLLVPCLLLMSCTAARPQPPAVAPVMSAELQQAFEQGPLCPRLDGVNWPCSDTDGRLWKEWYAQRQAAGVIGVGPDYTSPSVWQVAGAVLLVGTLGVLAAGASSYHSHYHSHYHSRITTRCSYGRHTSTCTTRSW